MKISVDYKGGNRAVLPRVKQAEYAGAYSVLLLFSDGVVKKVDFGNFLKKTLHPRNRFYLDESEFKKFKIEDGNIVWGENWDLIFPVEQLYSGAID
ncbi:hypothetical protein R80B4_01223 [Fibrobacteres bacterium R8-0-B4]